VQQRVGVQGDDQLGPHRRQAGVEGVALAGTWFVEAADQLAGGGAVGFGHGPGAVGGAVVDHQDLDRARVVLASDVGKCLLIRSASLRAATSTVTGIAGWDLRNGGCRSSSRLTARNATSQPGR